MSLIGQCEPIVQMFLLLTEYYAGPRDSLVRQYPMPLIGPYKPIVQMFLQPAEYYFGPRDSLVWQSPTPLIGPHKPIIQMFLWPKGLPGRDSRTGGYLVSLTLNHRMKKIDPLKMRRSELKSVNYCQNCYFCSGKCKEDTAILASVIFH